MVDWIPATKMTVLVDSEPIRLPGWLKRAVDHYWQQQSTVRPSFFRGPVLTVTGVARYADCVEIRSQWTDFAHFWFGRNLPVDARYQVHPLFAAACPITSDGFLVWARMAPETSRGGRIQAIGGAPLREEVRGRHLLAESAALREMAEEIGVHAWELGQPARWVGATIDADTSVALAVRVDLACTWDHLYHRVHRYLGEQTNPELDDILGVPWGSPGLAALALQEAQVYRHVSALLQAPELKPHTE